MYTTNIIENLKNLFICIALSKYFHKNVKSMSQSYVLCMLIFCCIHDYSIYQCMMVLSINKIEIELYVHIYITYKIALTNI